MATALLIKATMKITVRFPLTIFVPHAVEALLNFHHIQHFSVGHLTSYEVLLLTAPLITLLHCSGFNPASLLPSVTRDVLHDCLTLVNHLLTLHGDLQETLVGNVDFSWFTGGFYLKGGDGKHCARYAITTPFDVVEAASLPMATSDHRLNYMFLQEHVLQPRAKLSIFILIVDMLLHSS